QISGPERVRGCSSLARSEPILVRLMTRVGFCFVTGRRMSIFDSLVLKPRTTGFVRLRLYGLRRDEIRSGFQNEIKSAKIELCVICRPRKSFGVVRFRKELGDFLWKKRLEIGRTCVPLRRGTDYRMVRFCQPRS